MSDDVTVTFSPDRYRVMLAALYQAKVTVTRALPTTDGISYRAVRSQLDSYNDVIHHVENSH